MLFRSPIGPKAARLAQLIKKYPRTAFACLIDNPEAAIAMAKIFAAAGLTVPVYLDINVGMDRTGITPGDEALNLYHLAAQTPGITPVGLHAYDGHIRDTDLAERTRKCNEGFAKVEALRTAIETPAPQPASATPAALKPASAIPAAATPASIAAPGAPLTIIAGGSPTFPIHANRAVDIQCSPGTFVYWDKGYADSFPDQPFQPAALVLTRVISQRDTRLTLDLGHKSIAPENDLSRRVFFLNGPNLKPIGQSEEHLVVETPPGPQIIAAGPNHPQLIAADPGPAHHIGDLFYGVPYHICPTVALYDRAHIIESGRYTGTIWKNTARDRTITI